MLYRVQTEQQGIQIEFIYLRQLIRTTDQGSKLRGVVLLALGGPRYFGLQILGPLPDAPGLSAIWPGGL